MLPDLQPSRIESAISLTLTPYDGDQDTVWDNSARYWTREDYALLNSTFSFFATEGATYDIFSSSFFDPFILILYDQNGEVLASDESDRSIYSTYGMDYILDYQAEYTGLHYFSASWDQGNAPAHKYVSVSIYEDLDTIATYGEITDLGTIRDDYISGGSVSDFLRGGSGNDTIYGMGGNDFLYGDDGVDTAVYSGRQNDYTLELSPVQITITDRQSNRDGTDALEGIEFLRFDEDFNEHFSLTTFVQSDNIRAVSIPSFTELYIAYFNRAPDAIGFHFWGSALANGSTLEDLASLFMDQNETRLTYPEGTSNIEFTTSVYNNLFGRVPDQAGLEFWVSALDSGNVSRDQFILEVLRGVQNN